MSEDLPLIIETCSSIHGGVIQYTKVRAYGMEKPLQDYTYQRYAWRLHREDLAEISSQRNFTVTHNG